MLNPALKTIFLDVWFFSLYFIYFNFAACCFFVVGRCCFFFAAHSCVATVVFSPTASILKFLLVQNSVQAATFDRLKCKFEPFFPHINKHFNCSFTNHFLICSHLRKFFFGIHFGFGRFPMVEPDVGVPTKMHCHVDLIIHQGVIFGLSSAGRRRWSIFKLLWHHLPLGGHKASSNAVFHTMLSWPPEKYV